jgi:hypothetical protein
VGAGRTSLQALGLCFWQHHYPRPACVLRVRLVEARDLPAADLSLFSQRTSDPYCKIAIGQQPGSIRLSR